MFRANIRNENCHFSLVALTKDILVDLSILTVSVYRFGKCNSMGVSIEKEKWWNHANTKFKQKRIDIYKLAAIVHGWKQNP